MPNYTAAMKLIPGTLLVGTLLCGVFTPVASADSEAEMAKKIDSLVAQLTLEEKASLTSGRDNWGTQPIERTPVHANRHIVRICARSSPHSIVRWSLGLLLVINQLYVGCYCCGPTILQSKEQSSKDCVTVSKTTTTPAKKSD